MDSYGQLLCLVLIQCNDGAFIISNGAGMFLNHGYTHTQTM